jgi:hypothetical protein
MSDQEMMHDAVRALSPDDIANSVEEIRVLEGFQVSPVLLAESVWRDRYGPATDPEVFGFSDKRAGGPGLPNRLWEAFKGEWYKFACTKDPKYRELRTKVSSLKGKPATVVISAMSIAISQQLGIGAGILTPFIAIFLHGIVKLGFASVCTAIKDNRHTSMESQVES